MTSRDGSPFALQPIFNQQTTCIRARLLRLLHEACTFALPSFSTRFRWFFLLLGLVHFAAEAREMLPAEVPVNSCPTGHLAKGCQAILVVFIMRKTFRPAFPSCQGSSYRPGPQYVPFSSHMPGDMF